MKEKRRVREWVKSSKIVQWESRGDNGEKAEKLQWESGDLRVRK